MQTEKKLSAKNGTSKSVVKPPLATATDEVLPLVPAKNKWMWRSIGAAAIVIGWIFISWNNRYRFSAPVVMLALGWLAIVASIYFLARLGASAASESDPKDVWWKPVGKLEELQRQKRALFKAIKEVEFDQQMGKQSEADAREIITVYRAAAIEVIKAIESGGKGATGLSPREQIEQEVRARLQLAGQSKRNAGKVRHAKDQPSSAMTPELNPDADDKDEAPEASASTQSNATSNKSEFTENSDSVADRGPS